MDIPYLYLCLVLYTICVMEYSMYGTDDRKLKKTKHNEAKSDSARIWYKQFWMLQIKNKQHPWT